MKQRIATYGSATIVGSLLLIASATLVDLGHSSGPLLLASIGNVFALIAGLCLIGLPLGLHGSGIVRSAWGWAGTICWGIGTAILSLVDVPSIVDPTDMNAGGAFGPIGLVLLSLGFLCWFVAIQRSRSLRGWQKWIFLLAALWFFLTFPTIQLPLFVIPQGKPLFILLSGVFGLLQLVMGLVIRGQAQEPGFPAQREAFPR
jgi:hypothetical protein